MLAVLLTAAHSAYAAAKPNVILIITDDQGYGEIGAHGNPILRTPNLDKLHSQGVRLTDFHTDPTCSPTRAALMTGRYSHRTGVWHTNQGRSLLRPDETTLPEVFAANGYRTAIFGKWHLGDNYPFRPQDRGFQEVLIHGGGGVGQAPDYWGNDYFDDTYLRNGKPEKVQGYCTKVWFDNAMRFMETNRANPFFLYLSTNAPHHPYTVAPEYSNPYENRGVQAKFYGMIAELDENLGRLSAKLKDLGLEENTILIFMTDNGSAEPAFNAGMRGKKGSQYEGGHRVPFFLHWPAGGVTGGRDIKPITAHLDVLPTLLSLAGLPLPKDVRLDGMDLSPWVRGERSGENGRTLFLESQRVEVPLKGKTTAIMKGKWRLVGKQLFDIGTDPGQGADVAARYPDTVQLLTRAYDAWWTEVSTRDTGFVSIQLGASQVDSVQLSSHDWHTDSPAGVPWDQSHVLGGMQANGFWAVEFLKGGRYRVDLRRWPAEAEGKRSTAIPAPVLSARLKVGESVFEKPVADGASEASFQIEVKAGKTRLQTWFTEDSGAAYGAYYVEVINLEPTSSAPDTGPQRTSPAGAKPQTAGKLPLWRVHVPGAEGTGGYSEIDAQGRLRKIAH